MKTKRISLLLILALCITIGGVYAAWIYAGSTLTAVHGHIGSFGLTNAQLNNAKGTITVDATNAHLAIDQKDTDPASRDYTAVLTATGTITITFVPSDLYADSSDVIRLQYGLKTDNANPIGFNVGVSAQDTAKPLFTKFDTTTKTELQLTESAGTYTATVDASVLLNLITLNSFVLDSYTKYEYFSAQIGSFGNIGIEVSEIVA